MCSTSIFHFIMAMASTFRIFFFFGNIYFYISFLQICQVFAVRMIPAALLLTILIFFFLKLTAYIGRFLKNSQNFFIQSLPLYTSCLFSMLLNEHIVESEKPDEVCLLTFVPDEFLGLSLHSSSISLSCYTCKICISSKWCFLRFLIFIRF